MKEVNESLVEYLTNLIAEGIRRRGFHFSGPDEIKVLSTGGDVGDASRLRRLQSFALGHQWKVMRRDNCGDVLFQPLEEQPSTLPPLQGPIDDSRADQANVVRI